VILLLVGLNSAKAKGKNFYTVCNLKR